MSAKSVPALLLLALGPYLAGCHADASDASSHDAASTDASDASSHDAVPGDAGDAGQAADGDGSCSCGIPVTLIPGTEATCLACIDASCAGAAASCQSVCCPALDDTCENAGQAPYASCVTTQCATECASCVAEPTDVCAGNATGYTCAAGDSPDSGAGAGPATVACTIPVSGEGGTVDVCCFPWTYGPDQCIPLPRPLPSCAPGSYTFNCGANDSPASLDPSLTCGAPVPDVDDTVDYCCTRS